MYKLGLVFSFFILILTNCSTNNLVVEKSYKKFETISFDVVEKEINIQTSMPIDLESFINQWFNKHVKSNGIEGKISFNILSYNEKISDLHNGKRVDNSLTFQAEIVKSSLSQKKIIEGMVETFSTLEGSYSLKDFDNLIFNTRLDLVTRLSNELKSKI